MLNWSACKGTTKRCLKATRSSLTGAAISCSPAMDNDPETVATLSDDGVCRPVSFVISQLCAVGIMDVMRLCAAPRRASD